MKIFCKLQKQEIKEFLEYMTKHLVDVNMELNWDKNAAQKLRELGLSHEHAMIAIGQIAEHRQRADREGYERGYNNGYADAQKKMHSNNYPKSPTNPDTPQI